MILYSLNIPNTIIIYNIDSLDISINHRQPNENTAV